ncbi:MAG: glycoside hydrolase family 38 C-terminal domain-containing protein [Phycisphaerae bacterium]
MRTLLAAFVLVGFSSFVALAQGNEAREAAGAAPQPADAPPAPDRKLYVVATAHLDTQWLWTIQDTIREYVPLTLRDNFRYFRTFPSYTFSFEGAFRYLLAKEYYPAEFEQLKEFVASGRWRVCGSSVDAGDVNLPSPEALVRQVLYGNGFYRREFGKVSRDIYLPDCFGFGYALPTIAAHCGLKQFSSQKLTWGSAVGIPFDIGVWRGVDGSEIVAALNPGAYVSRIGVDLSREKTQLERIDKLGEQSGSYIGYRYFGTGDTGGAPDYASVAWLEKSKKSEGPVRVLSVGADQLALDLTPEQVARLPRYDGELLMRIHGVGCYTSMAAMKRWNRQNEQLADAAERASVVAHWLGAAAYPRQKLADAWMRLLWHHHHDDLTGTSIPEAYVFSWNDMFCCLNEFAETLRDAAGGVARGLDTRVERGVPVVVFNPLGVARTDVVDAVVELGVADVRAVRVVGPDGAECPAQFAGAEGGRVRVSFVATVPAVGFTVFGVSAGDPGAAPATDLRVDGSSLENDRLRVRVDENGDIASVFDKRAEREMLKSPIRLALLSDTPDQWDEWEIRYQDVSAAPRGFVGGPAKVSILERGPARATLAVERGFDGSRCVQHVRLAAGEAGDRVEVETFMDWRTPSTLMKATFPLAVSNPKATYDLGVGVIERGNNSPELWEVPAQQWADLTDADGGYGVAIANDCKHGWDKPDDHTLRLTLVHLPKKVQKDMGRHRFAYAVLGHAGDWRAGDVVSRAARLNAPLRAFQTIRHPGSLGRSLAFVTVNSAQVGVMALKQAEESDEIVIRVRELHGKPAERVALRFAPPIVAAREINGMEEPVGPMSSEDGGLHIDLKPYQPRAFALKLAPPSQPLAPAVCTPLDLPFDTDVVSGNADRRDGDFEAGATIPAELLPTKLVRDGVEYRLGSGEKGAPNAITCRGQSIALPDAARGRLYVLAAAAEGDVRATFTIDGRAEPRVVQHWSGNIGQSDSLVVDGMVVDHARMAPAFVKRAPLAGVGGHRHTHDERDDPYMFCYLFKLVFELPDGVRELKLPDDPRVRILAATIATHANDDTRPASDLYDRITAPHCTPPGGLFIEPVTVTLASDSHDAPIHYTLDGSEPTESSPKYVEPLRITASTTLRAITAVAGRAPLDALAARFELTTPRPAVDAGRVASGLRYRVYQGQWNKLPDFETLEAKQSGVTDGVHAKFTDEAVNFGVAYDGFIRVEKDGLYTFFLQSDDGSKLFVGDTEVVDSDGLHGPRIVPGMIALQTGLHPIRVRFFQRGGPYTIGLSWRGPGIAQQPVPTEALFHAVE